MTCDGILTVITPSGVARESRPPGMRPPEPDLLRIPAERQPPPNVDDPPPF